MIEFSTFDEIPLNGKRIGIANELRLIAEGKIFENILLMGLPGTGKTTLAHNLPRLFELGRKGVVPLDIHVINCDVKFQMSTLESFIIHMSANASDISWIIMDEIDKVPSSVHIPLHTTLGENESYDRPVIAVANSIHGFDGPLLSRFHVIEIVAPTPEDYLPYAMSRLSAVGKQLSPQNVLNAIVAFADGVNDIRRYSRALNRLLI